MKIIILFIVVMATALIQTAFLNPSYIGLNIILALIIALSLTQKISIILPTAWIAGLMIDLNKTILFGTSSIVFISLIILMTLSHRFFLSRHRNRNIIVLGILAVIMERFLYLLFLNSTALFNGKNYESFANFFITSGFLLEIIVVPLLILGIFKLSFTNEQEKVIRFSNRA